MKKYKAFVKDKQTKEHLFLEGTYSSKSAFIADIRSNGYSVSDYHVKVAEVFDWIIDHTNCNPWDWKENN